MARTHLRKCTSLMAAAALAAWASVNPAAAQCALCYTSAAATGERGAAVLRVAILVLLIPTMLTFVAVLLLTLRGLKQRKESWTDESLREGEAPGGLLRLPASQDGGVAPTL